MHAPPRLRAGLRRAAGGGPRRAAAATAARTGSHYQRAGGVLGRCSTITILA